MCPKHVPSFDCCNFDKPILIIFGSKMLLRKQAVFCVLPPHLPSASALPCETGKSLKVKYCILFDFFSVVDSQLILPKSCSQWVKHIIAEGL